MNLLVDMLEDAEVDTKVTRFSTTEGVKGLGENPFVSIFKSIIIAWNVQAIHFCSLVELVF